MATSLSIGAGPNLGDTQVVFTFNGDYQVGQFCNGDWWVIGGAGRTITAISPTCITNGSGVTDTGNAYSGRTMHGAQINPGCNVDVIGSAPGGRDGQGYDTYIKGTSAFTFIAGLNVDPAYPGNGPISMATPISVVKSISLTTPDDGSRPSLSDLVVLTVLASVPPADAFRPAQSSADKTILYRESGLNYGLLPNLDKTLVATRPTLDKALRNIQRPIQIAAVNILGARNVFPQNYQDDGKSPYGQFYCRNWDNAYITLLMDYTQAEKRPIYIAVVQLGIDAIHRIQQGNYFAGTGGCSMGLKFPAALCYLNFPIAGNRAAIDPALSSFPPGNYPEDRQLFFVSVADSNTGVAYEPQYAYVTGATGYAVGNILTDADPNFDGITRGQCRVSVLNSDGTIKSPGGLVGIGVGDYYTQPKGFVPYSGGSGTGLQVQLPRRFNRYTPAYVGTPDWNGDAYNHSIDGSNWDTAYRNICAYSYTGSHLAVRLIPGLEALWNNSAFVEYMYRAMNWLGAPDAIDGRGSANGPTQFQYDAWVAYVPAPVGGAAQLVEAAAFNRTAWLKFDYSLSRRSPPAASAFTVTETVSGVPTMRNILSVDIDGRAIKLFTDAVFTAGNAVAITYTPPATSPVKDLRGNLISAISGAMATVTTRRGLRRFRIRA